MAKIGGAKEAIGTRVQIRPKARPNPAAPNSAAMAEADRVQMAPLKPIRITPPIFAKVQEMSGSYVNGLIGLAVLTLVGAAAAALMKENRAAMAAAAGRVRVAH